MHYFVFKPVHVTINKRWCKHFELSHGEIAGCYERLFVIELISICFFATKKSIIDNLVRRWATKILVSWVLNVVLNLNSYSFKRVLLSMWSRLHILCTTIFLGGFVLCAVEHLCVLFFFSIIIYSQSWSTFFAKFVLGRFNFIVS